MPQLLSAQLENHTYVSILYIYNRYDSIEDMATIIQTLIGRQSIPISTNPFLNSIQLFRYTYGRN